MLNKFSRAAALGAAAVLYLSLVGCGTTTSVARGSAGAVASEVEQQQAAFMRTSWERQARLEDLSWPLLVAGRDLCGKDVMPRVGLAMISIDAVGKEYRKAAVNTLGIKEHPTVLHATQGAPAALAGLQKGDEILSIAGEAIEPGRKATEKATELLVDTMREGQPFEVTARRNGQNLPLIIDPVVACRYPVIMIQDDSLNAFADGNAVYVTTGMYRFAQADRELQLVLGHEIAHNAEGHSDKKWINWGLGTLLDLVAAAYGMNTQGAFGDAASKVYSQDFEREADYVGMYLLAAAGVDTTEAADFWRRMAAEYPQSIKGSYSASHPATAERWVNIDATNVEIAAKRSQGSTLVPERKK